MKKLFFAIVLCLAATLQLMAQKPNVYIANFKAESGVSNATANQVRNAVISGISATKRVVLIDAASSDILQKIQLSETSESALSDPTAHAALVQLGIDYVISGNITTSNVTRSTDKNGKVSYSAKVTYTLKLNRVSDGSLAASQEYEETGYGETEDAALEDCKAAKNTMDRLIQAWFPLRSKVLPNDYEIDTKKNEMTVCYVELGSDHGVSSSQMVDVFVTNIIAGRETQKMIGSLKITEVLAGDLSKCKVTKGGAEILKAMKDYESMLTDDPDNAKPLTVKTRATGGIKGFGKEFLGL